MWSTKTVLGRGGYCAFVLLLLVAKTNQLGCLCATCLRF